MEKISLNKGYVVSIDGFEKYSVDAPFSDFGSLIANGMIENPLVCRDADKVVDLVDHKTMVAQSTFVVTDEMLAFEHINICCDKIDTLCKCYINDSLAFESRNAHIPVDTDIKPLLVAGENSIRFELSSATDYIVKRQEEHKLPKNANGTDGAAYLRKPSCHFGWDWGPCVPYKYIGNVELQCFNSRIENITIKQNDNRVTVCADNANEMYIITPNGDKITSDTNEFVIDNPELWYTHDVSGKKTQPLYTVVIKNDEMTVEKRIGIRTIKLNQSADEYGTNFQFILNGVDIFAKGASVIPFAAIPEDADESTIDYYLDLCIKSNFNMIRIWGGGEYASDYLMDRCDELGILVWQDFMYACLMYPFYEDDFLAECLLEAKTNVLRLTTHPSLGLWCGNNELEAMFNYLPKTMEIMKAYEKFFYHQLAEYIEPLTDVDYIPSSPLGDKPFSKNTADEVGDTHMWNVWHGLKPLNYYEKRYTRFLSEFGLESLPSMSAIKQFASEDEFDLASDAFMSHQKCIGGNEKMMFYLKDRFDDPVNFNDLPYLTGIVQAECVKYATEHFRRNKGRCNGALFWQLNDVWCCPSWSSVDFLGVQKAMMYMARDFFAPLTVSFNSSKLYLHNDTLSDKDITLDITVMNGKKTVLTKQINTLSKANSLDTVFDYTLKDNDVMRVVLNGDRNFYFDNVKSLKKTAIYSEIKDGKLLITAEDYARYVYIDIDNFAENYFSLLPGETKEIPFDGDDCGYILCENNVDFTTNKIKTAISQLLYRLKPMNIANAFYYEHN